MANYSSAPQMGQYSGLAQKAFNDRLVSGQQMSANLGAFGPGSAYFQQRKAQAPGSLPLSMQPTRKVGRSMYDPTRLAEQAFRSTKDPMQRLQLGMIRNNLMPQKQDELDQITTDATMFGMPEQPQQQAQPTSGRGWLGNMANAGRNMVMNAFNPQRNPAISILR